MGFFVSSSPFLPLLKRIHRRCHSPFRKRQINASIDGQRQQSLLYKLKLKHTHVLYETCRQDQRLGKVY